MKPASLIRMASLLAVVSMFPSCALVKHFREINKKPAQAAAPAPSAAPALYEWNGDQVTGATSVRIALAEQKARIFKDGEQVGWTYVATGLSGRSTPTGTFHVMEKVADKRSNRWGVIVNSSGSTIDGEARAGREAVPAGGRFVGAPMPHWMRLTGYGIGMHGGPIPNPGRPASHGCIRLPFEMAGILFNHVEVGTPVVITQQ